MQLFYKQYGENKPPLIILHGLLGAHNNWHTLSRNVFSDVATVYAVDQRNHGRSPHTDRIDYPSMAQDLLTFIKEQGLSEVTVMGHSMGGKTAMQAALTHPDLIERLIVVDMAPRAYTPNHRGLIEALRNIDPTEYDRRSQIDDALAETVPSWPIRQFLLTNLRYEDDAYTWQPNLDVIARDYEALVGALPAEGTYEGPATFIGGARSNYISNGDWPTIRDRFPAARRVTIPDAGHWVHADAPEPFAEAVLQALDA